MSVAYDECMSNQLLHTYTINDSIDFSDFMKALEALESVAYTMMTNQEDSYNSLHDRLFKNLHSALLNAERIQDLDNK